MAQIVAIGTYLPPWQKDGRRVKGPDEDALTMAIAAGRAADRDASAQRVVMVSRNFPLLEGGNGAVLLAGLSLPADVPVSEVLGGGPAVVDQILGGGEGTLVIAADDSDTAAAAGAVLIGSNAAASLSPLARQTRSLPIVARRDDGSSETYGDSRLAREVGVKSTLKRLGLTGTFTVAAAAGVAPGSLSRNFDIADGALDATVSAAAVIRLIAKAVENRRAGIVVAIEQSSITVAELSLGADPPRVTHDVVQAVECPNFSLTNGVGIPISLAAYARAFEPKIRWEAAVFEKRPGIDDAPLFPPRARVDSGGGLAAEYRFEPLPRTGTVYTHTTIRIPVPDLPTPYSIALVQLDDSPVRVLLKVTGVPPGTTNIGQHGSVVLRRVADRAGIPDYAYMFWPGKPAALRPEGATA